MVNVRTFDAPDKLTRAAADLVLVSALQAAKDRGQFVWGLSGGNTPAMLYRMLAEEHYAARMPWDKTFVFWGDERWVPADHPDNNQRMAKNELLAKVPIPQANIRHIITTGIHPEESAMNAERQVRALFSGDPHPDLVLLGLGEDGHTASLFPGTTAILEEESLFAANWVERLETWRITATLKLLNAARHVVFLATGVGKAPALLRSLYPEEGMVALPASMVYPTDGELTWLIDKETASMLPHRS